MINKVNGKILSACSIEELREYFIGRKYGRLTITNVERVNHRGMVDYICDCGKIGRTYLTAVINGHANSCGCISTEKLIRNTMKPENIQARREGCILNKKANQYFINADNSVSVVANNNPNIIFLVDFYTWVWFSNIAWGVDSNGYMYTRINSRPFEYHTLLYPVPTYGKYVRDHRNRCKFDNRYANLRVISHRDNVCNASKKDGYTTNIKGVYMNEYGKYVAILNSSKHGIRLNRRFSTLEEAIAQRREWELKYQAIEELDVPPLIFPDGSLNVYNFPFGWYPEEFSSIWALLGLRVFPYSVERSDYINTASKVFRGDYSN